MSHVPEIGENLKCLTFTLAKDAYAIDIRSVREILDLGSITRIPRTPDFLLGVVNLRGNAIPVMDLRQKLGLGETSRTINTRIVILDAPIEDEFTTVGVLADSVQEVLELDPALLAPPPRMGATIKADFIQAMGKVGEGFVMLLDIRRLFSEDELIPAAEGEEAILEAAGGGQVSRDAVVAN